MQLQAQLAQRFEACGLELHPQKTKVVYCADSRRAKKYQTVQFDFLGYTFRPRFVKSSQGKFFVGFNPAISRVAARAIRKEMRDLRIYRRTDLEIEDIARRVNPITRGWFNYYGSFYRSALHTAIIEPLEEHLARWAMRKYRALKGHRRRARQWIGNMLRSKPELFAYRTFVVGKAG